jgi:hypothetical protein
MTMPLATLGPPPLRVSPRCRNLLSLAAFELAAGFGGTARDHLAGVAHCRATGCCASPRICASGVEAPPLSSPRVVRLPLSRTAIAPVAGGATIVTLPPAPAADRAGDRFECRPMPLSRLAESRRLSRLHDYWRELWLLSRGALADLDPVRLVQIAALGWVHLVDAGAEDPARFAIVIRGWRVPNADIDKSREGMRLGEHPVRLLSESVMSDYLVAREVRSPLYHRVRSRLRGHSYAYRRLILPLSSDGKCTDRLLVATDFG